MFKLHRYFSLTSIIGTLFIALILLMLYRHLSFNELLQHESRANDNAAHLISKALWPLHGDFISLTDAITPLELRQSKGVKNLHSDVTQLIEDLNIVNLKIYSANGLTIFSNKTLEIGEINSNRSLVSVNASGEISSLSRANQFNSLQGGPFNGHLVSSNIVIRPNEIVAEPLIFELHSDVSAQVKLLNSSQWKIVLGAMVCLTFIYTFLFYIVKYSDKMRFVQEERLQENEARLKNLNSHDSLTGLPNKSIIVDRLRQAMARSQWHKRYLAIATIDLDHFHALNDRLGRNVGDKFLVEVAKRLEKSLRGGDTVARIEDDKFVLLLNDMANSADISFVANKILARIREPVEIAGNKVQETASMGIAFYPTDGNDAQSILKKSDEALYIAKADGRNKYCLYSITDDVVRQQAARATVKPAPLP